MDDPNRPSRTADRVAERRAAHQVLDTPRIFEDPLALSIIRPEAARVLKEEPAKYDASPFDRFLRSFVSMRSRFSEDAFRDAYARGVRQYVVLGAGFDTFAYRHEYADLTIWELDHPATQAVKRERLEQAGIPMPAGLSLVPIDFSQASLDTALIGAGVDLSRPVFFAWLGVSMYLDLPDVRAVFRLIGSGSPGTCVVFDYATPPESHGLMARMMYGVVLRRLKHIGEPFKTFFQPSAVVEELKAAGFRDIEVLDSGDINARYFSGRRDELKVGPSGGIARACV